MQLSTAASPVVQVGPYVLGVCCEDYTMPTMGTNFLTERHSKLKAEIGQVSAEWYNYNRRHTKASVIEERIRRSGKEQCVSGLVRHMDISYGCIIWIY